MPTNTSIIQFLSKYAIVTVLVVVVGFWGLPKVGRYFNPPSYTAKCSIDSMKEGTVATYEGEDYTVYEFYDFTSIDKIHINLIKSNNND